MHDSFLVHMHALKLLSVVVPAMVRHEEDEEVVKLVGGVVLQKKSAAAARLTFASLLFARVVHSRAVYTKKQKMGAACRGQLANRFTGSRYQCWYHSGYGHWCNQVERWVISSDGRVPNKCTR